MQLLPRQINFRVTNLAMSLNEYNLDLQYFIDYPDFLKVKEVIRSLN